MNRCMQFYTVFTVLILTCFISSCQTTTSDSKPQSQTDILVQELHAEFTDVKHQIHNLGVDLRILEEKIKGQEKEYSAVQKKMNDGNRFQKEYLQGGLAKLEKKVSTLQSQRENINADIHQLKRNVNDLGTTVGQYKTKLQDVEKVFSSTQQSNEKNINNLKVALESLMALVKHKGNSFTSSKLYTVRSGDSLERIARKNNTTVEKLKEVNKLTSDLIITGDELRIPE